VKMASPYVKPQGRVVDLGCSRGDSLVSFVESAPRTEFWGYEVSKPMREAAKERFVKNKNVAILEHDLREGLPTMSDGSSPADPAYADLYMSILTTMFIPIEHRQKLIQDVYDRLNSGGAFIYVEKILGNYPNLNKVMASNYHVMKLNNGYTREEVDRKALSLEGVLVPITAKWNEDLLHEAGFRQVDCFWRWMNFAGWIAIKD
jgi:tRNA (cmo5U34)-methyltransferase